MYRYDRFGILTLLVKADKETLLEKCNNRITLKFFEICFCVRIS